MNWEVLTTMLKDRTLWEFTIPYQAYHQLFYARTPRGIYLLMRINSRRHYSVKGNVPNLQFSRLSTPDGVIIEEATLTDKRLIAYFDPIRMELLL